MKKNLGWIDRTLRTILALIAGVLIFSGTLSGVWAISAGILAVVLLLTSLVSFCPIYAALKISTRASDAAQ